MTSRLLTLRGDGWPRIFVPIGVFLAVFGVLNFAELPLAWKDRGGQITRYLDATVGLGPDWVTPTLWLAKGVELALGLVAIYALVRRSTGWLAAAVVGWMAWFTLFTAMDVWAADRAELQEHTVYFVMFSVLLAVIFIVSATRDVLDRIGPGADRPA